MKRIKIAIHLHTHFSHDGNRSPAGWVRAALREGIDCLAITDHNEIDGAIEAQQLGLVRVILGEEICTTEGHVLGLFLSERIPPGMSAERTIRRIHEQGGLAAAPHPFCTLCDSSLGAATERLLPMLDAIEIHNAQSPLPGQDRRALRFAREHDLPSFAGADAHFAGFRVPAYQVMPDFSGPAEFLRSLRSAEMHTGRFGPAYFGLMAVRHIWDKLMPRRLPYFGSRLRADESSGRVRAGEMGLPSSEA